MSDNARPSNWRPGRRASDRARNAVFDVLMDVYVDGAYANLVLPKITSVRHFSKQDAAYATNLCYGTLRLQGRWDAILAHCISNRRISEIDTAVLALLRMGTHQLLEFRTPPHAAINETVMLTRNRVGTGASGFVNAVLHRVSERSVNEWMDVLVQDAGGKRNTVAFLAAWYSQPRWIIRALDQALKANGRAHKDLISVLESVNTPAQVALAARGISVSELIDDIERGKMAGRPGELVDSAVILDAGDPGHVFAVQDRLAGVQDEGSQLVARALAGAPIVGEDSLWLDMCAGPGGKTATLAAIATKRGARIHANELHPHRLDLVEQATEPWRRIVATRQGDGRELGDEEPLMYDRVLIDAPCTGIGALRRRPEARWNKDAGDAINLAKLQGELLESGWKAVRPGGIIAYSTCSPYLRETHDVIDSFAQRHEEAELLDTASIAGAQALMALNSPNQYLQLWPDLHNSDAMFLSVIRKPQ
ncbi:MAG: transcription antitermination factor NusB [Actinomycetaceae bacterium]|nr:16S rRNA methyltransferase [Arcanobacterium sp.]MDD7505741.1 transcription antitermination factor NusB [Actinomycetaceae bacterium]MDY6143660.1 transcription antitermination factor NusB [Arcanobacterium sp.]